MAAAFTQDSAKVGNADLYGLMQVSNQLDRFVICKIPRAADVKLGQMITTFKQGPNGKEHLQGKVITLKYTYSHIRHIHRLLKEEHLPNEYETYDLMYQLISSKYDGTDSESRGCDHFDPVSGKLIARPDCPSCDRIMDEYSAKAWEDLGLPNPTEEEPTPPTQAVFATQTDEPSLQTCQSPPEMKASLTTETPIISGGFKEPIPIRKVREREAKKQEKERLVEPKVEPAIPRLNITKSTTGKQLQCGETVLKDMGRFQNEQWAFYRHPIDLATVHRSVVGVEGHSHICLRRIPYFVQSYMFTKDVRNYIIHTPSMGDNNVYVLKGMGKNKHGEEWCICITCYLFYRKGLTACAPQKIVRYAGGEFYPNPFYCHFNGCTGLTYDKARNMIPQTMMVLAGHGQDIPFKDVK